MWTATNNTAFLSLTIHYVDDSWKLKAFLLDIIPMAIRHTGVNMTDAIMDVLREFDLTKKALALTTDNASSMIACSTIILEGLEEEFDNLDFTHYRCAAGVLNLAVTEGPKLISRSIEKLRLLIIFIKTSQPANESLKVIM